RRFDSGEIVVMRRLGFEINSGGGGFNLIFTLLSPLFCYSCGSVIGCGGDGF
ncbi:hypothetical protein A2U01_0118134, partial [Trifolium medium]|nr:hypothetical protein [Trifolium medium]